MTTGELLDSKSTVSNTTALIHLQNIAEGSGTVINSELVRVHAIGTIEVEVNDTKIGLTKVEPTLVEVKSDIINIEEIKREVLDVVC